MNVFHNKNHIMKKHFENLRYRKMYEKNSFDDERMEVLLNGIIYVCDMSLYIHDIKTRYHDSKNIIPSRYYVN